MSRLPTEVQSARMGRLSRLPAFFALAGKRAVVAGGGQAAAWKAELLSAAGAAVEVFNSKAGEDMRALTAAPPGGRCRPATRQAFSPNTRPRWAKPTRAP